MTIKSQDYKSPSCECGRGNISGDVMFYVFTGAEAADTTVLMRRMSEYNRYVRITAIADSGMVGTVDVGYVSREDGVSDDLDAFKAAVDISTANQAVITDVVEVPLKHDVAITIKTNNSGNAGKKLKLFAEFVASAG
ncbi:MAG: hypothetical protein DRH10_00895 [Deltaproteobacteria bacterium]|nr:MAG: hypothetical protein DRH10_00895 [Deltaproteobacteria bacterium]RLC88371.1 MAG: hypothetical protein DRJ03_02960 [Chloroflexota bacterium]